MLIKLFLLGRPGCGKSSAVRYISRHSQHKHWSIKRFRDFDILKQMSGEEQHKRAFVPTRYDGFDVIDEYVFDEALRKLDAQLCDYLSSARMNEIIMIEFARRDNIESFKHISPLVLKDAYVLYVNTHVEKCVQRVEQRMINPQSSDDHYVSEKAIRELYDEQIFPREDMFPGRLMVIDNNGSLEDFEKRIDVFVDDFFKFK